MAQAPLQPPAMKSPLSTTLLVLFSSNLFLLLFNLKTINPPIAPETAFDPVDFLLSKLSTILMAYLSSMAYSEDHPSLENLLSRIHRSWRRPAITLLCIELFYTASASLLLTLNTLAKATRGAVSEAVVVFGSVVSVVWLGPVLFAHSEIACKLSLVMSVVEEEGWEGGMETMKKAGEMVEGRRLEGFFLTTVVAVVERAAVGLVGFWVKFVVWVVYTGFYYECRKEKHRKGGG